MKPPPIPIDAETIVIILPSWVGDAVMATPVLRAVHEQRTGSRIVGVMRPGLDELLDGIPWLDERIAVNPSGMTNVLRMAGAIRRSRPQVGLLLPNSFRSALSLRISGVPRRIGYARDGRGWLLTATIAPPPRHQPVPAVEYYADLAAFALGAEVSDRRLELSVTDPQQHAADALLEDVGGPFIVLNPGANNAKKRWPASRFAAVGDALAQRYNAHLVINGAPSESALASEVIAGSAAPDRYVDLAQRGVTLGSLKGVLRRAMLLITNDTGPRHIAAALGTPTVCLFGPTDHRWTTLPGGQERRLLAEPFLPEELLADQHPVACAIDRIPVDDVLFAAEALLAEHAARAASPQP